MEQEQVPKDLVAFGKAPHELMTLHLEAMFTCDDNKRLREINEPWPSHIDAPRFILSRSVDGITVCRYHRDVPDSLVEELEKLCAEEPPVTAMETRLKPKNYHQYMSLLKTDNSTMGPCWVIAEETTMPKNVVRLTRENMMALLQGNFKELVSRIDYIQPCMAVIYGGQAVSVCGSVRISSNAHEAGVETLEAFRQKGYAIAAVTGWAGVVRQMKAIPLYSTLSDNVPSQRLAKRLALRLYCVNFTIK